MRFIRKPQTGSSARRPDHNVLSIDLGFDRFQAQLLAQACRAAGCDVELLTMDNSGTTPGRSALVQHQLLVRETDIDKVRSVLARIQ